MSTEKQTLSGQEAFEMADMSQPLRPLNAGPNERSSSLEAAGSMVEDEDIPHDAQSALTPVSKTEQLIVLVIAFLDVVVTIGLNQAYGVFLNQYLSKKDNPANQFLSADRESNKPLLAFVGTLASGLTWSGSIVVNPVMARMRDPRLITLIGSVMIGISYVLASFCHKVTYLILTQGLLYGIGASMLYFPVLSVAPEYFDSHRGGAMGLILSGAGTGGLIYSFTIRALLAKIGIRWTLRAIGIANFIAALPIVYFTPKARVKSKRPTLVSTKIAKKWTFILQAVGAMTQAAGNLVPLTFLPEFSTTLGYSATFGAALLATNNAVNTVSRIVMGFIADAAGRQNTLVLSTIGSAVVVGAFWAASAVSGDRAMWITFVVMYGIFAGGYNSLFPTTVMEVFGRQAYASVNGFIYFIRGLGAIWGSPAGGAFITNDSSPKAYINLIWYDFGLLAFSGLCAAAVRGLDAAEKGRFKLKA